MASSRSLTGGTNDVNPQYLTFTSSQTSADTPATLVNQILLPIQRLPNGARAQVMEILKIFFFIRNISEVDSNIRIFLLTSNPGTAANTNFGNPQAFAGYLRTVRITTSGSIIDEEPHEFDCTDGAGHGILIATDQIFAQMSSETTGNTNSIDVKILYRMKNVSVAEYIGLVQSQQQAFISA